MDENMTANAWIVISFLIFLLFFVVKIRPKIQSTLHKYRQNIRDQIQDMRTKLLQKQQDKQEAEKNLQSIQEKSLYIAQKSQQLVNLMKQEHTHKQQLWLNHTIAELEALRTYQEQLHNQKVIRTTVTECLQSIQDDFQNHPSTQKTFLNNLLTKIAQDLSKNHKNT